MGWLTDIGNVAVGAIERDREITKEDLIIRAENLKANQQILVEQKKKKYDKELEDYYAEKKKFDDTERMNSLFSEGAIDDRTYAGFALSQEIPNFDSLPEKTKESMIANYKGKTFNYELTGSAEEINKKAASAITLINDETSEAIKNAKGNSFLINKILNRKEKLEKDIYASIESQLKAADAVKMTSKDTNKDNVGLDVKVSDGTGLSSIFNHNDGKWLSQFNTAVTKSEYDGITTENKILDVVATGAVKGFSTGPFVEKNDAGEITGWTNNGQGFSSFISQTYKTLHDNLADERAIIKSFDYNSTIGGANINSSKLIDESLSIVNQRAKVIKIDGNSVFSAIPIGVINENNQFIVDGQVFSLDNKNMSTAMTLYDNLLKEQATANVASRDKGWTDPQTDNDFINAFNELQINMNSNRNFVKDGKETNFAYEFKKMLVKDLNLKVENQFQEGSQHEGMPINEATTKDIKKITDEKEKVVTIDKEEKTKIDSNVPIVKDNKIIFKTEQGDQEISFENLDESQIEQLKITYPDVYKKYEIWKSNNTINTNTDTIANDKFTENTNTFKNMVLESEKKILSGNKKNTNTAKKNKNINKGG